MHKNAHEGLHVKFICITTECMKKDAQVVVRMPSQMREQLAERAAADQRSLASYIVLVLQAHLDQQPTPSRKPRA